MTLIIAEGKPPRTGREGQRGQPDKLTEELQTGIFAAIRSFQRPEIACRVAGCSTDVFYEALRTAEKAKRRIEKGDKRSTLTAYERKCMEFSIKFTEELAKAEARAIHGAVVPALNRQTRRKTTTKCIGQDDNNKPIMVTEETVYDDPPDTKNLIWWLTHFPGTPYQERSRVELTGADGGPIAIEFAARLEGIAGKIKGQDPIPAVSQEVE